MFLPNILIYIIYIAYKLIFLRAFELQIMTKSNIYTYNNDFWYFIVIFEKY